MKTKYPTKETESMSVSEPAAEFGTVAKRHYRVITDEEIERCMTLDESERLITDKIYRFYHPEACK